MVELTPLVHIWVLVLCWVERSLLASSSDCYLDLLLILRRVRQPPESGCRKSSGQIESLLGHQTCRKRLIIPPMYIETCLQQVFFHSIHHTVSRNVLKVRGWLTHLLKFGEMVIWICFEAKSYFFPLENWHPALSSHLLKFGEIVFVPHLISYLHIVCTPNLLNPSVPMETIVSQVNIF